MILYIYSVRYKSAVFWKLRFPLFFKWCFFILGSFSIFFLLLSMRHLLLLHKFPTLTLVLVNSFQYYLYSPKNFFFKIQSWYLERSFQQTCFQGINIIILVTSSKMFLIYTFFSCRCSFISNRIVLQLCFGAFLLISSRFNGQVKVWGMFIWFCYDPKSAFFQNKKGFLRIHIFLPYRTAKQRSFCLRLVLMPL